jgi:hypothetical protein
MKKFALLDLASFLLFGAFLLSLVYELWRDYGVGLLQQPTPLLRISDNRVNTMHENAPTYVVSFAMSFLVRLRVAWLTQLGAAFAFIMLCVKCVYLFDVLCLRIALSPLPLLDCLEFTLHVALLGAALLVFAAHFNHVELVHDRADDKKRQ